MKLKLKLLKNKGFSLIELMVVVAIIAILASFAIPQYQSFQSKARQKEGLTLLNSFYVAAKATEAEQGAFPGNFVGSGFNPAGQLHYRVVVADGTFQPQYGPNNDTCTTTANTCGTYGGWNETSASPAFRPIAATGCAPATNSNAATFTACTSATIRANGDADTWSIDQRKVLTNTNDGVN